MKTPILKGNEKIAYRDPACFYLNGRYYLFYTLSCKDSGFMYNRVAESVSDDMQTWSQSHFLTPADYRLNFCSPGNVIKYGDEYIICICSYPMPYPYIERCAADESARLFIMRSKNLTEWSEPEQITIYGDGDENGRKIDPYIIEDKDKTGIYHLFYKYNGKICMASSDELLKWKYEGEVVSGENPCCIVENGKYVLIYSPMGSGICKMESDDLKSWQNKEEIDIGDVPEWANGRLTAGFMMNLPDEKGKAIFFHGSIDGAYPETHGDASIGLIIA